MCVVWVFVARFSGLSYLPIAQLPPWGHNSIIDCQSGQWLIGWLQHHNPLFVSAVHCQTTRNSSMCLMVRLTIHPCLICIIRTMLTYFAVTRKHNKTLSQVLVAIVSIIYCVPHSASSAADCPTSVARQYMGLVRWEVVTLNQARSHLHFWRARDILGQRTF